MKRNSSRGGATALMIVSIAILVLAIAVTLVFTLRARQGGDAQAEKPDGAPVESAAKPGAQGSSAALQAPDWMAAEKELDELIAQPWTPEPDAPAPDDGGETAGEPDTQTPPSDETPPETPPPDTQTAATPEPVETFVNPFSDVKESDYFYEPLMWAAKNGIVSGDSFSPAAVCSRAQALTFLWRQQGEPEPKLRVSPFTDVSDSNYYYKPVLWAFENSLISTPSDGKFKPSDAVNRAQVMTFLFRLSGDSAKGLANPYSNVGPNDYYYEPALWAYSRGIVILDGGNKTFDATSACTRAQYITFLYRCFSEGGN